MERHKDLNHMLWIVVVAAHHRMLMVKRYMALRGL